MLAWLLAWLLLQVSCCPTSLPAPPSPWTDPQLVPAVTELVISELLWLNYASPEKPIYVYINSTGA